MRELVTIDNNEKYLRQVSKKVDFNDKDLAQDIAELKEYTLNNAVFAMASVQIGIPKRLLFVKSRNVEGYSDSKENQILMINPEIISQKGRTEYLEVCKSCMGYGGWVERPYEIVVKYQDIKGKFKTEKFEGFTSKFFLMKLTTWTEYCIWIVQKKFIRWRLKKGLNLEKHIHTKLF